MRFLRDFATNRFEATEVPDVSGDWTIAGVPVAVTQDRSTAVAVTTIDKKRAEFRMTMANRSLEYTLWVEEPKNVFLPEAKEFKQQGTGVGYMPTDDLIRLFDPAKPGGPTELVRAPAASET